MKLEKGQWVVVRHCHPFIDESHQIGGVVESVKPSRITVWDKLRKRQALFDVIVETDLLGKVMIRRVSSTNVGLVLGGSSVNVGKS